MEKDKNKWYSNFFTGLALEFWQESISPELTRKELEFLHEFGKLDEGDAILDVFCGYGRHAIPLARQGMQVTGVDQAGPFLDQVQGKVANEKLGIQCFHGDFLDLDLPGQYSLVYCLGNSFSYFDEEGTATFLDKVSASLLPGGTFILNTVTLAESHIPNFQEHEWHQAGQVYLLMENDFVFNEGYVENRMTFMKNEKRETKTARHYLFTLAHLKKMFLNANIPIQGVYSSTDEEEYMFGDIQAYIVASKTGNKE